MGSVHYLDAGIYTVPDVAKLVRASQAQVRGWVEGHPGSRSQPIVLGEFDRPYGTLASGFGLAFLTDPWGTYIELTEGLRGL
jgi:hypothetical protein